MKIPRRQPRGENTTEIKIRLATRLPKESLDRPTQVLLPEGPRGDDPPLSFLRQERQTSYHAGFKNTRDRQVGTPFYEGGDEVVGAVAGY